MATQNDRSRRSNNVGPDAFRPGHLFWMPAGSTWLNRDKPRPFSLATPCSEGTLGTLVYGSSQETEKSAGAACIEVAPVREGLNRNSLRARTWFYPGTLLPVWYERLPRHSGFLGKSLQEFRAALRFALGIGRGSCIEPDSPAGSRRGRIVALNAALALDIGATFGVVLTEPQYSAERSYQIILPIFSAFSHASERYDLVVFSRDWLHVFPTAVNRVLLPIPVAQSVWHRDDVARETDYVVDDETLRQIDQRLCDYFSLTPPDSDD